MPQAAPVPFPHDLAGRPEILNRGFREFDLPARLHRGEPGLDGLPCQRESRAVVVRTRGLHVGQRRRRAGSQPVPEIELPGNVERKAEAARSGSQDAVSGSGDGQTDEVLFPPGPAGAASGIGIERGPRDPRASRGGAYPGGGGLEVVVSRERVCNQAGKGLVVECTPPQRVRRRCPGRSRGPALRKRYVDFRGVHPRRRGAGRQQQAENGQNDSQVVSPFGAAARRPAERNATRRLILFSMSDGSHSPPVLRGMMCLPISGMLMLPTMKKNLHSKSGRDRWGRLRDSAAVNRRKTSSNCSMILYARSPGSDTAFP